ncbi:branched-chain amino acid ABC transporter permease [Rhizobium oryzicola]|uniref:Branched-chain amino acid ABC transporter permease n=1 Tax=Rhizobium oryzicola TaxID=1232668 RepID=A0ABT8STG0_9HYPH|nr:branched-chain amino acid ABC transporter permease [Rhizobium oryzicola]MDO1581715.1 branched-chain amino acid ABC transporter permease [Rhizobium oryzicola]
MVYFLQQLANAVPLAMLYATLSFGYVLAFAVTKRADIAYGALFAFSGHIFLLGAHTGWNLLWLTFPAALAFGGAISMLATVSGGMLFARYVMLRLERASPNALIVATLGALLVMMEGARIASGTRELWLPPFLNDKLVLILLEGTPVTLTLIQLINVFVMGALLAGGTLVLDRTSWGNRWRAVADDALAAELCGVSARTVFIMAYGAAALIASFAGIVSTAYFGTMDFGAGLLFGLKCILIAAAGGHAHPLRSAAGAAVVGFAETFLAGYGPLVWRELLIFSALVALLVVSRRERVIP